MIFEGLWDTED